MGSFRVVFSVPPPTNCNIPCMYIKYSCIYNVHTCLYGFFRKYYRKATHLHKDLPGMYSSISPYIQNCQSSTIALDEMLQFGTYRVETSTSGIRSGIQWWYLQVIYLVKHVQRTSKFIQCIYLVHPVIYKYMFVHTMHIHQHKGIYMIYLFRICS